MLNTRHMAELIAKGEINEMKDAMEKSLSPGSQTFEQALFGMLVEDSITQDEALGNSDSATNLLWLINNTEAGMEMQKRKGANAATAAAANPRASACSPSKPASPAANTPPPPAEAGSFASFKLDVGA